jgi:hypothetical protein
MRTTIIHDGESNFLSFSGQQWVPGMDGDIFEGTYPNAVRMARKAPRENRRIFVSTNYGLMTQEDREINEQGDIGTQEYPNAE